MFKALNVWRANSDITEPSSSKTLNDRYCHAEKTSISVAFVFFQKSHLFELLHLFNLYSLGISELLHWHITETVVKTNKSIHVCFQPGHTVCTNCVKLRKNWTWSERLATEKSCITFGIREDCKGRYDKRLQALFPHFSTNTIHR